MKYEAHITYNVADADKVEEDGESFGAKYSQIDGDPLMGAKPYCYLSLYGTNAKALLAAVEQVIKRVGVEPLRKKIERIVFDTKTGIDEITKKEKHGKSST